MRGACVCPRGRGAGAFRLTWLAGAAGLGLLASAAAAGDVPMARVDVSGAGFAARSGADFGSVALSHRFAFGTEPGATEYGRWVGSAAVETEGAGFVLKTFAEAESRTRETNGAGMSANAFLHDRFLVAHGGGGPGGGLLTLRLALDAGVVVDLAPFAPLQSGFSSFEFGYIGPRGEGRLGLDIAAAATGTGVEARGTLRDIRQWYPDAGPEVILANREETFEGLFALAFDSCVFDLVHPFRFGEPFELRVSKSCRAGVGMRWQGMAASPLARFDAGNSLRVVGLALTDLDGRPIADARFSALSGIAFPMLPGSGGVIPEPTTWAMLVAGFGLVGGTLRRQRWLPARVSTGAG